MELTNDQIYLIQSIYLSKDWFKTNYGCPDSVELENLICIGYVVREKSPRWIGDKVCYKLTYEAKELLRKKELGNGE